LDWWVAIVYDKDGNINVCTFTYMNYERIGKVFILIGLVLTIFFTNVFVFNSVEADNSLIEPSVWGQYGDIIGGCIGTIIALVGVFLLFETLKQQRIAFAKQQVTTHFFELLKIVKDNSIEVQIKDKVGKKVYLSLNREFELCYDIVEKFVEENGIELEEKKRR